MGVAAYNRGSQVVRKQIAAEDRSVEFEMMDHLNGLPKFEDAGRVTEDLTFTFDRGVWWVETARRGSNGYGFWYKTLREAVRRWHVDITGYDGRKWLATPRT